MNFQLQSKKYWASLNIKKSLYLTRLRITLMTISLLLLEAYKELIKKVTYYKKLLYKINIISK
jgi:hypothetical protein